ncbi:Gag-pol fusion polyprotein [Elysia marginata]|uniref:Gag-pol fusion polyprotein n=1 Tax=Elysia marginata TaxID=1093978 RepID=A0AAV4H652_9GAST|nr:Gag-pol fusion polyprotein [Elysia marginata]
MAKSRVTPLRPVTIPRQAAVLSVKVAELLQEELNFSIFFWTDSQIVLAYLHNQAKRFNVYVANRVQQILQFSRANHWRHVKSEENPADDASRGLRLNNVPSRWFQGPDFLLQPRIPAQSEVIEIADDDVEIKFCKATSASKLTFSTFEERIRRFSSKSSLMKGVAAILRCCAKKKGRSMTRLESFLTAESRLISCIQREHFSDPSPSLRNSLKQLNCYTDENGLLRVGGRLNRSYDRKECRHPAVLPRDSHLSILISRECHEYVAHQGRTFTVGQIRASGYWIIGSRRVVASLLQSCIPCLHLRGQPAGQLMSDLTSERMEASPPFSYCGMDCFGPFCVKDGRKEVKRYGLIVKCLASRVVHSEVLDDISTESLINGLRNVIAIRGQVRLIRCHRRTNFVGASNEL